MHIDRLERTWILIVVATMSAFLAALVVGAVVFGVRLPEPAGRVNPSELQNTQFNDPQLVHLGGNKYEVHILARTWAFVPNEIRVPAGSEVTFYVTSQDITHGFIIEHHNINLQLVPGHISRATGRFNTPGTYKIQCHEYCGRGHHLMNADLIVEEVTEE